MNQVLKHRVLGVAFLCLLLFGVWLVNALFNQQFKAWEEVTLQAGKVGLQLPDRADVKVRGQIIGQVLETSTGTSGALLTLGIEPDKIGAIPENVTASLIPKTLFGEKYVSLVIPRDPAASALRDGSVIEKTKLPIEVEELLNDLYPLLRTVQPAQVSYTLNALATALEGRGDDIGENIEVLDAYLQRFNPKVPGLLTDLRLLAKVSGTYADVMPEIADTLRNTVKTGRTFREKERELNGFLTDTASFSDTTREFLDANGDNIVRLGTLSQAQTRVLAKYAPEFPCLLGGVVNAAPRQGQTFRGFVFHINLRTLPRQPRGYNAGEVPVYGAKNGPHCGSLPSPPWSPQRPFKNNPDFADGAAKPQKRTSPGFDRTSAGGSGLGRSSLAATALDRLPVTGTPQEKAVVVGLTAPVLGRPADQVDDLTTLLYGPLVRGSEVSVQ